MLGISNTMLGNYIRHVLIKRKPNSKYRRYYDRRVSCDSKIATYKKYFPKAPEDTGRQNRYSPYDATPEFEGAFLQSDIIL